MIRTLSILSVAALGLAACGEATDADIDDGVEITVENATGTGTVYVALQSEGIFGGNDATYGGTATPMNGMAEVEIAGVMAGDYAVAAFQDTNGNGVLDIGGNGVPTEPWALSNGAGTAGAPAFADARITFDGDDDVTVTLVR